MPEDSFILLAGPYYIHTVFRLAQRFSSFKNPLKHSVAYQWVREGVTGNSHALDYHFTKSYTFLYMAALMSYFWRAYAVLMRRDSDSLRVKCHFNSLLPFMESICRRDFSAQKVRRQTEVSERWKAVYSEHIFSSLLTIDAHGEICRTIEEE